jgi:hypothetical protein
MTDQGGNGDRLGDGNMVTDLFSGQAAVMDAPSPTPSPPRWGRGTCGGRATRRSQDLADAK